MDEKLIAKLVSYGLPKLQKVKSSVDPSDPDMGMLDEAIKRLSQGSRERNLARAGEESAAGDEAYAMSSQSLGGAVKNYALGQLEGSLAALHQNIPAIGAGEEAIGDLAQTLIPSQRENIAKVWPTPGSLERSVERSPDPISARTLGGSVLPVSATGVAGKALETGARTLLAPATRAYSTLGQVAGKVLPGQALPRVFAGGGAGASLGLTDAAIRRVPGLTAQAGLQPSESSQAPISLLHEAAVPAAFGMVASSGEALAAGVRNPATTGGVKANIYAGDRRAGLHDASGPDPEFAALPSGPKGTEGAVALGKSRKAAVTESQDQAVAGVREANASRLSEAETSAKTKYEDLLPERLLPVKAERTRGERELVGQEETSKAEFTRAKGEAAAEIAPDVTRRLEAQRREAKQSLEDTISGVDADGSVIPTKSLYARIEGILRDHARSDTVGSTKSTKKETGLVDAKGEPLTATEVGKPGSGQKYTPYGRELAALYEQMGDFLKTGGTVSDWMNQLKYLKSKATGTPEKAFPYKQIIGTFREEFANAEPRIGEAWERYRVATTEQEGSADILFRQPDLHKLGGQSAHARLDVPDMGDPFTPYNLTPHEETQLRSRLLQLGHATDETAAAKMPERAQLVERGFGPEVNAMERRLGEISELERRTGNRFQDARAALDERIARAELEAKRALRGETEATVEAERTRGARAMSEAETARTEALDQAEADRLGLLRSQDAREASRWPSLSKLAPALTLGAAGAAMGPFSTAHGTILSGTAATIAGTELAQPIRSRLAYHLPDTGSLRLAVPGLMQFSTVAGNARDRLSRQTNELVEKARSQGRAAKKKLNGLIPTP